MSKQKMQACVQSLKEKRYMKSHSSEREGVMYDNTEWSI